MAYRVADIVAYLQKRFPQGFPEDPDEYSAAMEARFPDATRAEMIAVFAEMNARIDEFNAEVAAMRKDRDELLHIFEGLGDVDTREAVEIKAAQGDAIALRWQKEMNDRSYLRRAALWRAACNAHPRFVWDDDRYGGWRWIGDGDEPSDAMLIDWFQRTHPAEARRIEKLFEEGT